MISKISTTLTSFLRCPELLLRCPETVLRLSQWGHRAIGALSDGWESPEGSGGGQGEGPSVPALPPKQQTRGLLILLYNCLSVAQKKNRSKKLGQKQSLLFQSQYNIVLSMQSLKNYRSNTFFIYLQRNIVFHVQSPTFKDQQHGFIVFCTIIFLQFKKKI